MTGIAVRSFKVENEGVAVRGRVYGPDDKTGCLPTVLFCGGSGRAVASPDWLAQSFVARGMRFLALDHLEHGKSSGWTRSHHEPWQQVRELREVVTYLLGDGGASSIGLYGVGLGATCSLMAAAEDPRVAAVVAVNPHHFSRTGIVACRRKAVEVGNVQHARNNVTRLRRTPLSEVGAGSLQTLSRKVASRDALAIFPNRAFARKIVQPLLLVLTGEEGCPERSRALALYRHVPEPKDLRDLTGAEGGQGWDCATASSDGSRFLDAELHGPYVEGRNNRDSSGDPTYGLTR